MLRHIVFFSAKNKADIPAIISGLETLLAIPHADLLEIRENQKLDSIANEIDVIVYGEFRDAKALAAFKAHPLYAESIRLVRPLRELRFAADYEV